MEGYIYQISIKPETPGERGLPKHAVPSATVAFRGLVGDFNRYRHEAKGDDPAKALLLLPLEALDQLQREGWPVRPGDLGENVTTRGLPYDSFEPGKRYRIGKAVEIEISRACTPCGNLRQLPYAGSGEAFVRALVGRRGWYARVLREGEISVHDSLTALSDEAAVAAGDI